MLLANCREQIPLPKDSAIGVYKPDIDLWIGTSNKSRMNDINRASIVVEIDYENKRLLFAADSESSDWTERASDEYNVVKMSHHGTTKPNMELLKKTRIHEAIISTNGRRNHPEDELLALLIKSGVNVIHFNYNIPRKKDLLLLEQEYGFKANFCESKIYF